MRKSFLRTVLWILAAIVIALAIVVAVLALTPLGGRALAGPGWGAIAGSSGISLSVDSVSGGLARGVTFEGVRLSGPGGELLFEAAAVDGRLARFNPFERAVALTDLRVRDAYLLLATAETGGLVGWSGFRSEEPEPEAPDKAGEGWTVGLDLSVYDLDVAVLNAGAGSELLLAVSSGEGSGTLDNLESSLAGSVSYEGPGVREAVVGTFGAELALADGAVTLAPLSLKTNTGDLLAEGALTFAAASEIPSLDIVLTSSHDLTAAGPILGAGGLSGLVRVDGEVSGALSAPSYSAHVRGEDLANLGIAVDLLDASLTGDARSLEVTSLRADGMGGALTGSWSIAFPGPSSQTRFPQVKGEADFEGFDLSRFAALSKGRTAELSGDMSGGVSVVMTSANLSDLHAELKLDIGSLNVAGRSLGSAVLEASATDGDLTSTGACCGAAFEAAGSLSDRGVERALVTFNSDDLSPLAEALDVPGLSGRMSALAEVSGSTMPPLVGVNARSEDLEYSGVQLAPFRLTAASGSDGYDLAFTLFDSTVVGSALLDTAGHYRAVLSLASFDLGAVAPDSLRESMALAGLMSASVTATGDVGGGYHVEGSVTELDVAVRRQRVTLERPFELELSPDSLHVSDAALEGTLGSLLLSGRVGASGSVDLTADLRAFDLASASELLPVPPRFPPSGTADGVVRLEGTREAPVFSAMVDVREFDYAGLALDTATLDAEGDSSDVLFDFVARSAVAGSVGIFGAVPVVPDTLSFLAFDPRREFGVSIVCSAFTMDAGHDILPAVRGTKRFTVDGSAILAGTADSLSSVFGIGHFSGLGAQFDLVEFALADTVYLEVTGGSVAFDEMIVDVTRKRVLGEPYGGRVVASGHLDPDGEVLLQARTSGLDVGHLIRALGPGGGAVLGGTLDAEAAVEGSARDPRVEFSLTVESPSVAEFGFDRLESDGVFEGGVLNLRRALMTAGDGAVEATGSVRTARSGGAPGYDLALTADEFRLGELRTLPPEIDKLGGRVSAGVNVRGSADSVSADGALSVEGGKLLGFGLAEPVKDIALRIDGQADGTAVAVLSARSGGGSATASGLVDLSRGAGGATFFVAAQLESPEFEFEDRLQGSLGGHLEWGGSPDHSMLRGRVVAKDVVVTKSFGLGDVVARRPQVRVVRRMNDPRAAIDLDVDVEVEEAIEVRSNVAQLSLTGGASVGGTMMNPVVSGSVHADGGTFTYFENEFDVQALDVSFIDPRRRDPYVSLLGVADIESRSGEEYQVTAAFEGFLNDAVPQLTSVPPLNEPDIVSLLTFGTTFGTFVSGDTGDGSSGDTFADLAGSAFLSSAFGIAESALERLLRLDRVAFEEEALTSGNASEAGVTLGKDFGSRLRVNYTTAVGRFSNQKVEVSFELLERLWVETRTDPEGNHAVGLKLRIPFR